MPIIYNDGYPITISGGVENDLRFGSVRLDGFAAPSWYGLHDNSVLAPFTADGRPISYARIFATQPWVFTAIMRMLTWSVRVPLKAYRRTGDDSRERLRPGENPIASALIDPWTRGNQAQLVMSLLGPLLVHGNSTIKVENGARDSLRFTPKDWRYMDPIRIDGMPNLVAGWNSVESGETETIPLDQLLHTAWWSPLGPIGVSPLQPLGVTLAIEDAAQGYTRQSMSNMNRPPSAVTVDDRFLGYEPEQRAAAISMIRAQIDDTTNIGKPAILPAGLDWKAVGHSAQEAELIEVRKVTRNEVAAAYMVPPPMIGILDDATYSNIETQRQMAYTDGLAPPLALIEQAINAQVVRGLYGLDDVYVEFDFAGILRGDRLKEIQAIREAINTGVLTPNEGRSALNYPSSDQDGMDQFYLPTNNLSAVGNDPNAVSNSSTDTANSDLAARVDALENAR